ncbi:hypothetical protein F5Y01DRAFT_161300 [Xylaria sp. FL0043]|nr:hypothetical protein F5Y01DRAFT_161300 [Xylaria sp. FL0043]
MWPKPLLLLSLSTFSRATLYKEVGTWFESAPSTWDEEAQQRIIAADSTPTISRSVNFQPFKNVFEDLDPGDVLLFSNWTWRVNVTEIPVPDAQTATNLSDPHIISLTWDFSWYSGKTLNDILGGDNETEFCWVQMDSSYDLPANITNLFREDVAQNSTSCVPAFGQACVDAILHNVPGNCDWDTSRLDFTKIPECAAVFADSVHHNVGDEVFLGNVLNTDETYESEYAPQPPLNGGPFYLRLSEPVSGAKSEEFEAVANGLNIAILNARIRTDAGHVQGSELICTRVNATKLVERDVNGDGAVYVSEVVLLSGTRGRYSTLSSSSYVWTMASLLGAVIYGLM